MLKNARIFYLTSLVLISVIVFATAIITFEQFNKNVEQSEFYNQEQSSQIIAKLIEQYFDSLKNIVNIVSSYPEITKPLTKSELNQIYKEIYPKSAQEAIRTQNITTILSNPTQSINLNTTIPNPQLLKKLRNWQIFKGIPITNIHQKILSKLRGKFFADSLKNLALYTIFFM